MISLTPTSFAAIETYAAFFESAAWGIHLSTYLAAIDILVTSRIVAQSRSLWSITLATSTILFIVGSFDVAVSFLVALQADEQKLSQNWEALAGVCAFLLQTLVGDAFLVYRVFIIYSRDWKIRAISLVLLLSQVVLAAAMLGVTVKVLDENSLSLMNLDLELSKIQPAFTLTLNIFATSIVTKIIRSEKRTSRLSGLQPYACHAPRFSRTKIIVVESALIYTLPQIGTFVLSLMGSVKGPMQNVVLQMVGVAVNTIIIRVNNAKLREPQSIAPL